MKEYCVRLKRGQDLKLELEKICKENNFDTCVILSGVGCLYKASFRLAKAVSSMNLEEDFEIVSLNGTISKGNAHVHIALSRIDGSVLGGHLLEGCLINTTCELVLGVLEEYESDRPFDKTTGYDEIEFKKVK